MTDDEYKTHMTMWAAVKSPLIIGSDVRKMDAQSYSIHTNPAILAISQDPAGSSANQQWRLQVASTDSYGLGEIQLWVGALAQGNYVVILLNGANKDMKLNATLSDIFVDEGGARSAEAMSDWDLYDLWAGRMPNDTANAILKSNSTAGIAGLSQHYYNSTALSYQDGIMANHTVLMGTHCGMVSARGTITATVRKHGVAAYRLRPAGAPVTQ